MSTSTVKASKLSVTKHPLDSRSSSSSKSRVKPDKRSSKAQQQKPVSDEEADEENDDALLRPKQRSSSSPSTAAQPSHSVALDSSTNNDEDDEHDEDDMGDGEDELKLHIIERPAHTLPPSRSSHSARSTSDSSDDDENESEGGAGLTINRQYAAQYESEKRQQELSKKAQRGQKKSDMIALIQQEMAGMDGDDDDKEAQQRDGDEDEDDEDEDEDENEEEDDEGALLTEELDVRIHETLNAIKRKDPRVYDKSTVFFADDEQDGQSKEENADGGTSSKRKVTVKQLLLESMDGDEEEEEDSDDKPLTHVQEQAKLKRDLLVAANSSKRGAEAAAGAADKQADDDDEDDEDLFKVRITSAVSDSSLLPTSAAVSAAPLSSSAFLTSYLSHQWWKADPSTLPSWSAIRGEQPNPSLPTLSDEEEEEDREEAFEAAYNFRHQEEGAGEVKTWPRVIEDSVRRKDNTRKVARERKKEAAEAEKKRQEEELKRLKNDKLRGIQAKVREVEEVSGVMLDDEVRRGLRLDKGWDEEEHERLMAQLFDNDYYDRGTANEDEEAAIERIRREEEEEDAKSGTKATGGRGRLLSTVHPRLRQELLADMDELYALDYEDVIGGGSIKTRFHYTKVKPDTYGLTLDDILQKEDKELNKRISIKKLAPYRADNEPVDEDEDGQKRKGRGQQWGNRAVGYQQRRVEGVKRKLEAKKKEKKQQQQAGTEQNSAGQTDGKEQPTADGGQIAGGADGMKQKSANGSETAAKREDGKLTATQRRRLREKNRKARLTAGAANITAEANGTAAASQQQPQQPNKRLKAYK